MFVSIKADILRQALAVTLFRSVVVTLNCIPLVFLSFVVAASGVNKIPIAAEQTDSIINVFCGEPV